MDKKDKNILVIGNGFDIYHGLKTGYYDFIKYAEKGKYKDNIFIKHFSSVTDENDGWIDCENELEYLVNLFQSFLNFTLAGGSRTVTNIQISYYDLEILKSFDFVNNRSGHLMVSEEISLSKGRIDKRLFVNMIRKQLDTLIDVFRTYLKTVVILKDIKIRSKQFLDIKFEYVVNFNYTDTCKLYDVDYNDIFYVHGSIKDENMVLGIKDSDDDDELDFVYFKKYFQRIQKHTGMMNRIKFAPANTPGKHTDGTYYYEETVVYFFGHSLSNTDGYIIRDIEALTGKMVIYFYNQEDYENKVVNIISVFGKKRALELFDNKKITFMELDIGIEHKD